MPDFLNPYHDPKNAISRPIYSYGDAEESYRGFDLYDHLGEFHAIKDGVVWYMCAGLSGLKSHIDEKIENGLDDHTTSLIQAAIEKANARRSRLP